MASTVPFHSREFVARRLGNWFPLGLFYAFLYFGRYNLTVAKTALGSLMTNEDFGWIFGAGTIVYGVSFILNGPFTDRYGGKVATILSACGAAATNIAMGLFIHAMMTSAEPGTYNIRLWMSLLYAANMYFQSFGAVSIVKVNSAWFHVNERGVFSGIFGMMISAGIFLAFSVNGYILDATKVGDVTKPWLVFYVPALFLIVITIVELFWLKDTPADAGHPSFDTGDASSGQDDDTSSWRATWRVMKKVITNPIVFTIALIEFCTGVLRQGVMHWGPFYFKEVWVLPGSHGLRYGSWSWTGIILCTLIAAPFLIKSIKLQGKMLELRRAGQEGSARQVPFKRYFNTALVIFLIPFCFAGWGGLLMAAGCLGGVVAGQVSHAFFQDRRAPAAGFLYGLVTVCAVVMIWSLGGDSNVVGSVGKGEEQLKVGDEIVSVNRIPTKNWEEVRRAVAAIPATCTTAGAVWDAKERTCSTEPEDPRSDLPASSGTIEIRVMRHEMLAGEGATVDRPVMLKDPKAKMRAGDERKLNAAPRLDTWPWFLGLLIAIMSFGVIGTHGLLSGTATQDFGGTKGAATAVGIIDGFVYLGTGLQSVCLGYLTTKDWSWWPLFLIPFGVIGLYLLTRIWQAKPKAAGGH